MRVYYSIYGIWIEVMWVGNKAGHKTSFHFEILALNPATGQIPNDNIKWFRIYSN